jgi:hypothetical protein
MYVRLSRCTGRKGVNDVAVGDSRHSAAGGLVCLAFERRERSMVIDAILAMLLMAAWWIGQFNHLTTLWLPSGV